jgi:hypothetical protein
LHPWNGEEIDTQQDSEAQCLYTAESVGQLSPKKSPHGSPGRQEHTQLREFQRQGVQHLNRFKGVVLRVELQKISQNGVGIEPNLPRSRLRSKNLQQS